jgi:outer membrane protein
VPYVDATWYDINGRERGFISTEDGAGISLLSTDRWKAGPYLDYRRGRNESASGSLRGLGDSNGAVQWGGYVRYEPHDCCGVFLKARRDFGDDHGAFVDLGAEAIAPIAPAHWFAGVRTWATWSNRSGVQTLFGVTPEQSQASGLRVHAPSSGIKSVTAEPSLTYQFDEHWAAQTFATYERLLGGAADSPLVKTRGSADQVSVGALVIYHF